MESNLFIKHFCAILRLDVKKRSLSRRQNLSCEKRRQIPRIGLQLAAVVAFTATSNLESFGEKICQIALGIAGVVVLVVAFVWLQAGTLAYAAEPGLQRLRPAFEFKFRRIGWSLLGLMVLLTLMLGTEGLVRTLISRNPSFTVESLFVFFLAPALVLPWIMAKVGAGGRLRAGVAAIRRWEYRRRK